MTDVTESGAATVEVLRLMARLRNPDGGCPWDLEQDFATIAPYTLEEAYEVADAIERGAMDDLRDELGDLLLQVAFHAQMASELGLFDFADVARTIAAKMRRRHPHVFADGDAEDAAAVAREWELIKVRERAARPAADAGGALAGVPRGLPSLLRAVKVQKRAAGVGFDWPDTAGVIAKVREELDELEAEMAAGDPDAMHAELGDVLFSVSNLARRLRLDADASLRSSTARFEARFATMERLAHESGADFAALPPAAKERLWSAAKAAERQAAQATERSAAKAAERR